MAQTRTSTRDRDDPAVLARLRAGEAAAFEQLVRDNHARLLSVARRILRSDEDARDAVQDSFLHALEHLHEFHGEARLSTWLYRIAINTSLMKLRGRTRRREEPIDPLLPRFYADGHRVDPGSPWRGDADLAADESRTRVLVRACIDRLPDAYRTVLVLRDVESLDTEETARALGISRDAVKMRLHRARQALRALLSPHFAGELPLGPAPQPRVARAARTAASSFSGTSSGTSASRSSKARPASRSVAR